MEFWKRLRNKKLKIYFENQLLINEVNIMTEEVKSSEQNNAGQTIIINQQEKKSNGVGTAGFVLALIALFVGWIPVIGWIVWLLGLILSFVGVFKEPRGMSIAGLVISLIGIILLLIVFAGIGAALLL